MKTQHPTWKIKFILEILQKSQENLLGGFWSMLGCELCQEKTRTKLKPARAAFLWSTILEHFEKSQIWKFFQHTENTSLSKNPETNNIFCTTEIVWNIYFWIFHIDEDPVVKRPSEKTTRSQKRNSHENLEFKKWKKIAESKRILIWVRGDSLVSEDPTEAKTCWKIKIRRLF